MNNPKVLVLLPVYRKDSPTYFCLSIDSMLAQTYEPLHILIGIDGPIEGELAQCVKSYASHERITILPFEKNRGLASTLNDMLRWAQAHDYKYYARMDADDISLPHRIQVQMDFLLSHPEIDVVGGAINEIDEEGNNRNKVKHYPLTPEECYQYFAKRDPLAHPTVIFRQSFFEKINDLYDPTCRLWEDTALWYQGFLHGTKIANVNDIVLNFRVTSDQAVRRTGYSYAKIMLEDRKKINKDLHYGFKATLYAYLLFIFRISPQWLVRLAYKIL